MKRCTLIILGTMCIMPLVTAQGGRGMGSDNRKDMGAIHNLLGANKKVKRVVKLQADGVQTITESEDPKVAALIKEHVLAMQQRMRDGKPIRMWDPLFAELFANHKWVKFKVEPTPKGMKVIETSEDAYVVKLIQEHSKAVTGFVKDGMAGMHKEHPAPAKVGAPATPKFLGKGDGIATCPVTGEPVDKSVKAEIMGRTVYFCCKGCVETVMKNPSLYLKPPQ